ncbi:MAG: transketolase C-terminal domain-containing protein [Armatimonadota bacterium]
MLSDGCDVAIIACGLMVPESAKAVRMLESEGIRALLVDMHAVKPLDAEAVIEAARAAGAVVTVEDNNILGGLGSAVAEVLAESCPVRVRRIGIRDVFGESGDPDALLEKYGMSAKHIAAAARELAEAKR